MEKKIFLLVSILIMTVLVTAGCSSSLKNETTGKYGPSWDTTIKLPVESSENTFGDLVEAQGYNEMGLVIRDEDNDDVGDALGFSIKGSNEKPISKSYPFELPTLQVNVDSFTGISETVTLVQDYQDSLDFSIDFPLPEITFAESDNTEYNRIAVDVDAGSGTIDDLTVSFSTPNSGLIGETQFTNVSADTKYISFNGKTLNTDELIMNVSFNQSSSTTDVNIDISGLNKIELVEVNNLSGDIVSGLDLSESLQLGDAVQIDKYDTTDGTVTPEVRFALEFPESSDLDLDFSGQDYYIKLNENEAVLEEGKYVIRDTNSISLGTFAFNGQLITTSDDGTFSYNANDEVTVTTELVGKTEFENPMINDQELPFEYSGNDLIYEMEPREVEISQEDIDLINKGIDKDKTYLETQINNQLPIDVKADLYLGNNPDNLYQDNNNVTGTLLEINSEENKVNKFIVGETLDQIEGKQENGTLYMGIKFFLGDLEDDDFTEGKKEYFFADDQKIYVKSHIGVTVKVNQ